MPISGYAVTGPLLALACGTPDPVAIAQWTAVCQVLATYIPANAVVNPGLMVAAGAAVSGLGTITLSGSAAQLGPLLALAAGSPPTDAIAITKWTQIADAIYTEWNSNIKVIGSTFVAVPLGGPITGVASLQITAPILGGLLAAIFADPIAIPIWIVLGTIMETQFITLGALSAIPLPIGMTSPPGGGPLVGSGTIL